MAQVDVRASQGRTERSWGPEAKEEDHFKKEGQSVKSAEASCGMRLSGRRSFLGWAGRNASLQQG